MYISDKDQDIRKAFTYLVISIVLAIAGAVYEHFSFGVWSNFMVYAFMIPLAGGTLPYMLRYLVSGAKPRKISAAGWVWHSGIATLTVGSVVHGILAISGRPNHLTIVYLIAGTALLASAAVMYVISNKGLSEGCAGPSAR